jgi:hypothetical protein
MSVVSRSTKARVGAKMAKGAVKNPGMRLGAKATAPVAKLGVKAGSRLAKRRARRRAVRIGEAMRSAGETLVTYGPQAAQNLGLVEVPKPKRTAPRVAAGVVIGAGAMYFLEPEHGKEHREKVAHLVS